MALTKAQIDGITKDGTWRVDHHLYLQVRGTSRSWTFRFKRFGRTRWMGLGPTSLVTLSRAKEKVVDAQKLIMDGQDPIEAQRRSQGVTFAQATEAFIKAHESGWTNPKHRWQVQHWMETYAWPTVGKLPVEAIDSSHVVKVLEPIWTRIPETAGRVRMYVERILDWAKAAGYRSSDNPAAWRGALEHRLPALSRVQKIEHHVAIPHADAPAVYGRLAALGSRKTALALRLVALTAVRAGEALGTKWDEFDLEGAVWTIPAGRMKGRKEHRVPLSAEALAVLALARGGRRKLSGLVFPGQAPGKPVSDSALRKLLRQVGPDDADTHGWRSTFRDWAGECTSYPREVAELALAHTVGSKVERAYARSDLFEKRAALMNEWSNYLTS